jgi:hypothetical protein
MGCVCLPSDLSADASCCGGSRRRAQARARRARDSIGGLYRPRDRLGGSNPDRGARQRHRVPQGRIPVGGERPLALRGARRGLHQAVLFDPDNHRVLGGGVVGTNAGELISEIALAVESGCDAADIGLTIQPHPTLTETVAGAAEAVEGTLTDLYIPKKGRLPPDAPRGCGHRSERHRSRTSSPRDWGRLAVLCRRPPTQPNGRHRLQHDATVAAVRALLRCKVLHGHPTIAARRRSVLQASAVPTRCW